MCAAHVNNRFLNKDLLNWTSMPTTFRNAPPPPPTTVSQLMDSKQMQSFSLTHKHERIHYLLIPASLVTVNISPFKFEFDCISARSNIHQNENEKKSFILHSQSIPSHEQRILCRFDLLLLLLFFPRRTCLMATNSTDCESVFRTTPNQTDGWFLY